MNIIRIVAVRVFYNGISAKRCLVEIRDATKVVFYLKGFIVRFAKPFYIYAKVFEQVKYRFVGTIRFYNRLGSPVSNKRLPAYTMLVPFGMTSEIIMIIEDQNLSILTVFLLVKITLHYSAYMGVQQLNMDLTILMNSKPMLKLGSM